MTISPERRRQLQQSTPEELAASIRAMPSLEEQARTTTTALAT